MNVYTDYSSQGAEVRTTAFEEDTCDGDRGQKFPGSPAFCPAPTCRDVFSFSYKASVTSESWHWYCTPEMSTSFPLENTGYSVTLFNQNVSVSDSTLKNMCTNYRNKWQGGNAFYIYLVARSKPVCSQDLFGTIYNETARVVKCEADVYYRDGVCTEDSTYREVNCCDK